MTEKQPDSPRILVVDADAMFRDQVVQAFHDQGWDVHGASNATEMDTLLETGGCRVLVLDQILPGESGLSICRRLNRSHPQLGIFILSQCADETERIVALELGADDYILKPCSPRELVARVRAFLRRHASEPRPEPGPMAVAPTDTSSWLLNLVCNSLWGPSGAEIQLAATEIALLHVMVSQPMTLLSRDELLAQTRGRAPVKYPRIIDITISRLRRKISRVEPGHELIRTVRGRGYVLTGPVTIEARLAAPGTGFGSTRATPAPS